jgi:uncharacterized protein
MSKAMTINYEWDNAKALSNLNKHGITFDQAATVFLDGLALTVFDSVHSQHEERWFTLGYDANGALLAVAHTHEAIGSTTARVRIISARSASKRERRFYEDEPR